MPSADFSSSTLTINETLAGSFGSQVSYAPMKTPVVPKLATVAADAAPSKKVEVTRCCVPIGCPRRDAEPIFVVLEGSRWEAVSSRGAVKVACSNSACAVGRYMHADCFNEWERRLVAWMKACRREGVESLVDQSATDQLWRGVVYKMISPAAVCMCGAGSLRRVFSDPRLNADEGSDDVTRSKESSPVTSQSVVTSQSINGTAQQVRDINDNSPRKSPTNGEQVRGINDDVMRMNAEQARSLNDDVMRKINSLQARSINDDVMRMNAEQTRSLNDDVMRSMIMSRVLQLALQNSGRPEAYPDLRIRTASYSSAGSSPPSSGTHSPPSTPTRDWLQASTTSPSGSLSTDVQQMLGVVPTTILPSQLSSVYSANFPGEPQPWSPVRHGMMVPDRQIMFPGKKLPPLQLGNMFRHRSDLTTLRSLPVNTQNTYNIRVGDEGPHGNDQTRCFVLKNLTKARVRALPCAVCNTALTIYDEFPLIDGTFFLSPRAYNSEVKVTSERRQLYLNAVCVACLDLTRGGTRLACRACSQSWSGKTLVIGTMYSYDVFAAMICCPARFSCTACGSRITDCVPRYFSDCSQLVRCAHCGTADYHLTKPLRDVYSCQKIM